MEIVYALLAVTAVLVALIAGVLAWCIRSGQFEDLEGPAWRVVLDDDETAPPAERPPDHPDRG